MRTVLLTGAAGRIGTACRTASLDRFRMWLADRSTTDLSAVGPHEVIRLNVADLEACRQACAGIDTVVHLAADPNPEAGFYDSLLESIIKGTFTIFRAASDAGCRRIVLASSAQALEGTRKTGKFMSQIRSGPRTFTA